MEDKIKKAAAEVFHTNIDNINIKYRLLGGMSNYTYVISYKDELYTIRLLGDGAEIFVDRVAEYHNLNEASKLGIVNETVYFNIETGVKVSKYIKGEWITKDNVKDHYEEVAELLRKVHTSNLTAYSKFDPIGRIEKYQKHSNNYNPEYEEIKKWWKDTYIKNYQDIHLHLLMDCKDLTVIGHDKLYLLDWEFSGSNDPLYDVSYMVKMTLMMLLTYYQSTYKELTEEEYYRIRFYACNKY